MKRITFYITLGLLLLGSSITRGAQQTQKLPRVGFLSAGYVSSTRESIDALRQGLRERGYVEGKTIELVYRYAEGNLERLPELMAELVQLKVDIIVVQTTPAAMAAKRATSTIPIIIAGGTDPVATGVVSSLAKPGGNITGMTIMNAELAGKRLEVLKETTPKVSRVAVLWNSANPGTALVFNQTQAASQELRLQLQSLEVKTSGDLTNALNSVIGSGANGLVLLASPPLSLHLKQIADFATQNRLPSIYDRSAFPDVGGLMSYGTNIPELHRHIATYVDKILKGTKPADLPIEQPTKFELVVNLKTAKEIGLVVPQRVLLKADRVIK